MGRVNGTYKTPTGAKKGTLGPVLSLSLSLYIYIYIHTHIYIYTHTHICFRVILTVVYLELYYEDGDAGFYVM
jgi:hypothetical protein